MPPTPYRIAQTSTELKKQHRKNGSRLNERQQKQLDRDVELQQRATHAREAEARRKAAKKKREKREAKEARARKQMGIGLATQLIGFSHTQAQLKNGMEAFLGLKRSDEEKKKKETELARKQEEIAEQMEKEPWDDDDDADDDTLLEAHDMVMSDPVEVSPARAPPLPATVTPPVTPPNQVVPRNDPDFLRTHGPINKAIEAILDRLPEPIIELLSQDLSMSIPTWDPSHALLHKLNPIGLPPHRLRIKVGSVVSLLRDLHVTTDSQLSKSQHLRILRAENDRLECLVLDGQLEGTKTVLTRVPFSARYKNLDQYPFQRTQFPIRVATGYTLSNLPRSTTQSEFKLKLPTVTGRVSPSSVSRRPTPPVIKAKPQANQHPSFTLPGLPASKSKSLPTKPIPVATMAPPIPLPSTDCWDDFLESSTQISRELESETASKAVEPPKAHVAAAPFADCLPPMSTQDLDFSLDDLEDERELKPNAVMPEPRQSVQNPSKTVPPLFPAVAVTPSRTQNMSIPVPRPLAAKAAVPPLPHKTHKMNSAPPPAKPSGAPQRTIAINAPEKPPAYPNKTAKTTQPPKPKKIAGKCLNPGPFSTGLAAEIAKLRPSQRPKSTSPPWPKRKATAPTRGREQKRQCVPASFPAKAMAVSGPKTSFEDFILSTQDAASFFEDDDSLSFGGSPPIRV
ncbi:hypothetical protein BDW02DRAFT_566401 [Decorospora gaudefroyi]|uniref:ATP-dependent DNA helicase n=1 Tax=Decorospora gaudefroyi TaxID=184978 RepID=A0A6A5KMT2_9PLEO|nr:hypothetical protein BDW02DRAFT_566401 [Decorospora gaudefroyi]